MVEGLMVVWCGVLVAWTASFIFPPVGHRRFVWVLWCASLMPAFLAYKWLTAPVFSWVTE